MGRNFAEYLDGVVHEPTQAEGRGFDLTVTEIFEITGPGRIDFGGGELAAAETVPHERQYRDPDDEYAWWHLDPGTYLVEYNESTVGDDTVLTLQSRIELLTRGAVHPTLHLTSFPRIPLTVGGSGLRLKENGRISTIVDATPA